MNTITDANFKELYPKVEEALKNASFIAIDAEFSGLQCANEQDLSSESLFDSPNDRYAKLRKNIEPFIAIQIGLTTFVRAKHENKYNTETFDFHLIPRSLPTRNRMFLFQAAAIEFLSSYNFDFNQFAYNAISYMDEVDEAKLTHSLKDGVPLWYSRNFVSLKGQEEIESCFNRIQKWLADTACTDFFLKIQASSFPVRYLMEKELRHEFKGIWTESLGITEFSVIKVTAEVRQSLEEKNAVDSLDDELLDYYVGFSKIFKLMTSLKKPIVGHNLLLDLMFMHKQFFRPLPGNYEAFKRNINQLFPLVYDTKFLSFEMKKVLDRSKYIVQFTLIGKISSACDTGGGTFELDKYGVPEVHESWGSNILCDLYSYFKDGPGQYLVLNSPRIALPGTSTTDKNCEEKFHDAGWDSYCTGYCFVKMAHLYAVKKLSKDADMRDLTNAEIMSGVKERVNRINLIRADLSYLRLDGPDPASTRPRWLYVRTSSKDFTTRQIAQVFSRFGTVDVKRYSGNGVLVAVPNHGAARDILKCYEGNTELRVVPYNPLRHSSRTIKAVLWVGSLVLSGAGVFAWMLRRSSLSRE